MSNFYVIIVALADDDNRIALKPLPEFEDYQGDYINACYVDVRNTTHTQLTIPSIHVTTTHAHKHILQTHPTSGLFYS